MGKLYVGSGNLAKSPDKVYIGINNIAKTVEKIYVGVNGQAVLVYPNESGSATYLTQFSVDTGATSFTIVKE